MKQRALVRMQTEFHKWVNEYNVAKKTKLDPEQLFEVLSKRIPEDYLRHIGAALINGWLETETGSMRGFYVRESDRPGDRGGQYTITNYGGGVIAPCWELFVQLADYAWMRSIAEKKGQQVWIEDRLMDITVSSGDQLILYIENKEKAASASSLFKGMQKWGEKGFNLDDPDRGMDPLRKAKYIVKKDARPFFLGMSAIGYRQLFKIEYFDGNRFRLIDDDRAFSAHLLEHPNKLKAHSRERSPVDPLACEIERLCPEIWISVGSGKTAFNFYIPTDHGDAILIGVYQSGELWTDILGLGPVLSESFSSELAKLKVNLDTQKQWGFWKMDKANFNLASGDPVEIANAVRVVLDNR